MECLANILVLHNILVWIFLLFTDMGILPFGLRKLSDKIKAVLLHLISFQYINI